MKSLGITLAFSAIAVLLPVAVAHAQHERQLPPPEELSHDPSTEPSRGDYSAKFFDDLQKIFGRFRDSDLKRVFDAAQPVQCSDLITDKGEWREVAFFNENRKLGDWYHKTLDEVKADLSVYIFKGACGGQRAALRVTTEFPVGESIERAEAGKIRFDQIDVNLNAPASVIFDPQSRAYTFDLPYLFHVRSETGDMVYTLQARTYDDRYDPTVTNHWDCKAVKADDVTYQFLICHNTLVPRDARERYEDKGSFGSSAYSILSDGKEASSSVHLSFGDTEPEKETTVPRPDDGVRNDRRNDRQPEFPPLAPASPSWRPAPAQANLSETGDSEFRLRFKPEAWKGRIDKAQLIEDGTLPGSSLPPRNKDYCMWRPSAATLANKLLEPAPAPTVQTMQFRKDPQGVVAVIEMDNDSGSAVGSLQCFFAQARTPADITVARWLSIVGSSVVLESPAQ
ncbi:MAG TPA: hypothetical protein VGK48_05530 [Terriglobia bacterium]|jgi:hypothetical protein